MIEELLPFKLDDHHFKRLAVQVFFNVFGRAAPGDIPGRVLRDFSFPRCRRDFHIAGC